MKSFEEYLVTNNIAALEVSTKAKVRYIIVWNAIRGNPITLDHANKIKQAVLTLTGVPYPGTFVFIDPSVEDIPTIPIKKIRY